MNMNTNMNMNMKTSVLPLTLRPYQEKAVEQLLYQGNIYQMIDMGLGKTAITLTAIREIKMPTIVFAPLLSIYYTWVNEIKKWTPDLSYVLLHDSNKDYRCKLKADIYLINYEGIQWLRQKFIRGEMKMRKYFVVWDESTMLKALPTTSIRCRIMDEMMPLWSKYRTCLSATPAPKNLLDLWHQYYLLDKGKRLERNFYKFRNKYFLYSGKPRFITTLKPGMDVKIMERVQDITVQVKAEDHLDLPPVIYNYIKLKLPLKIKKVYDELLTEFIYEFKDKTEDYVVANSQAILNHKLLQLLQGGLHTSNKQGYRLLDDTKAQVLKELCDNTQHIGGKGHIIAAINFRFEYEILCKVFKQELPLVAGGIPAKKSIELLTLWNKRKIPLLIVHPASVSRSLNLQYGGHILVMLATPWDYYHYHQLIGRLRRHDQEAKRVIVHHIIYQNTVDLQVAYNIKRKQRLHELIRGLLISY